MTMMKWTAVLTAALALAGTTATAQTFPQDNVVMVVPATAGGPTDVIGRRLADAMGKTLGHKVIVENIAGAGGTLGSAHVAKASPDGYTILLHNLALASAPSIYPDLPYDTATGFAAVGLVNYAPYVLVGNPGLSAATGADLMAAIRADGSAFTMGHGGDGSAAHLCGAQMAGELKSNVVFVPYKGGGPALLDVIAGVTDLMCSSLTDALPQIGAGKLRAYAVTSTERLKELPDTPTFAELGIGVNLTLWTGIFAPAGTPADRIEVLNKALRAALADEGVKGQFEAMGSIVYPADQQDPKTLQTLFEAEIGRWAAVIQQTSIKK